MAQAPQPPPQDLDALMAQQGGAAIGISNTSQSSDPLDELMFQSGGVKAPTGLVVPPTAQPSSTRSPIAVDLNGQHLLLPLEGSFDDDTALQTAIAKYRQTGAHLGIFDSLQDAQAHGQQLGVQRHAQEQLQRTDLPEDVRGELQQIGAGGQEGRHPVVDAAIGAGKALGEHLTIGGNLLRRYVPGVQAAEDAMGGPFVRYDTERSNRAQQVGAAAESIGEVVAPAGAINRGAALASRMVGPGIARAVGGTAARLLPAAAVQGGTAAGQAYLQGGDPTVAGVMGAAIPVVGEVAAARAPGMIEDASRRVVKALGPTKERFKAMAEKIAPQMLARDVTGLLGATRKELQEQAANMVSEIGDQIDGAIQQFGARQPGHAALQTVHDALEASKAAFYRERPMTITEAIQEGFAEVNASGRLTLSRGAQMAPGSSTVVAPVVFDQRPINQLTKLQATLRQLGPNATVEHLVALRRAWDQVVADAGGYAHRAAGAIGVPLREITEAWAKEKGTRAIRSLLERTVPELAAINREFSFWKTLDDVLRQTLKRTAPQGQGLTKQVAEAGGAAMGASHGTGAALFAAKISRMAHAAFNSPRWLLASARLKNQLAEAIMSGSPWRLTHALARVAAVEGSGTNTDAELAALKAASPEQLAFSAKATVRQALQRYQSASFDHAGALVGEWEHLSPNAKHYLFGEREAGIAQFVRAVKATANDPFNAKQNVASMDTNGLQLVNPLTRQPFAVPNEALTGMLMTPGAATRLAEALQRPFSSAPISAGLAAELVNAARANGAQLPKVPMPPPGNTRVGPYTVQPVPP